jgi:hypothetical protein
MRRYVSPHYLSTVVHFLWLLTYLVHTLLSLTVIEFTLIGYQKHNVFMRVTVSPIKVGETVEIRC